MYLLRSRPVPTEDIEDDDENASSQTTTTTTASGMSTFEIDDDNANDNYSYCPSSSSSPMQIVEGGKKFYQRRCYTKRETGNFSQLERDVLIEIVLKHKNLSPDTPHKTGLQLTKEAWIKIAEEFYQRPEVTTRQPQPIEVLKSCWTTRKAYERKSRRYKIVIQPGRTRNAGIEVQIDSSYAIRQKFRPEDTEVYTGSDNPPMSRGQFSGHIHDCVGDPLRLMRQIVLAQPLPNVNTTCYERRKVPVSPYKNRSRCSQHKNQPQGTNEAIKAMTNENEKPKENSLEERRLQLFLKAQKDLKYLKEQMHNVKAVYTQRKTNSNSSSQSSN